MKINKHQLLLLLLLHSCCLFAQQEAKFWHFGNNAGIVFPFTGPGIPSALTNSNINTGEGCASISSASGQLLFYTDGTLVYDKNGNVMPEVSGAGNELTGNSTSTQSAIIVPRPGSAERYFYIFTVDGMGGVSGLRHSLVDMSLNGGNGDIVPGATNKNVLLKEPVSEKIAACKDPITGDFWIIAHDLSDNFLEYKVTNTGVQSLLATIPIGVLDAGMPYNFVGYLKFSPNGKKLAMASYSSRMVEVFDFNSSTGAITGGLTITDPVNLYNAYGIEFSPSSQYLYTTGAGNGSGGNRSYLNQYDLIDPNVASSPPVTLASFIPDKGIYGFGALQLGPDNRIYVDRFGYSSLAFINNPDNGGASCNYKTGTDAIDLGGFKCSLGLPTFVSNYTTSPVYEVDPCCPPWNRDIMIDNLKYGSSTITNPYTLHFVPTQILNDQMQAYIIYLNSNPLIKRIIIDWELFDVSSNTQIGTGVFTWWDVTSTSSNAIFGSSPIFDGNFMQVDRWYKIQTWIYLGDDQSFYDVDKCGVNSLFVRIRKNIPILEFSYDGVTVVKTVPIP